MRVGSPDSSLSLSEWRLRQTVGSVEGSPVNRLFWGDNLGALRALPTASVDCVYIDPPYNTGNVFQYYHDGRSRDEWLSFMEERIRGVHRVLAPTGSLFIQIDDNEMDYLRVMVDGIFGADALVSRITVVARSPSAFSTVNRGVFKASEYILWFARERAQVCWNTVRVPRSPDPAYRRWIDNPDAPPTQWTFSTVKERFLASVGRRRYRADDPDLLRFVVQNARHVARLAAISDVKAGAATVAVKRESLAAPGKVFVHHRSAGQAPVVILDGQQVLTYDRNVHLIDGEPQASMPLTNVWTDIAWEGIAGEGGVQFKQGKKPERLLRRILQLATNPGDHVLDLFGGAGTTAAVAHKMGRRWTLSEQGPQAISHVQARLERVVAGTDRTGISAVEDWTGGGGFEVWEVRDGAP